MKMKITYWGDQPPKIECENLSDIEIEMVDGEEAEWLFLKHGGVSVYHAENSNDVLSDWWFSTVRGIHSDNEDAFDIQDLPEIPEDRLCIYDALYGEDEKQDGLRDRHRTARSGRGASRGGVPQVWRGEAGGRGWPGWDVPELCGGRGGHAIARGCPWRGFSRQRGSG